MSGRPAGPYTVKNRSPVAGDVIELGVGVGHELVALLGGGVQADRVVHLVLGAIGHLLVAAVDGGRGSVHQVLHRMMPAGLQDVVEAEEDSTRCRRPGW